MKDTATAVSVEENGGDARWFLGTLATIKLAGDQTGGRLGVFETLLPYEAAPPLHSHPQDETFYIIDGEMSVWIGGLPMRCTGGSVVYFPGGTPHTFFVESETARVLVLSTPSGIEQFVLGLSEPALEARLPDDDNYPPTETIKAAFAQHRVSVLGPPPTRADLAR